MKYKENLGFYSEGRVVIGTRDGLLRLQKALNKAISSARPCKVDYLVEENFGKEYFGKIVMVESLPIDGDDT